LGTGLTRPERGRWPSRSSVRNHRRCGWRGRRGGRCAPRERRL